MLTLPNVEKRLDDDPPLLNLEATAPVRRVFAMISRRENAHVVMLVNTHMSKVMDGRTHPDPVKVDPRVEVRVSLTRRTYHVGILLLELVTRAKHVYKHDSTTSAAPAESSERRETGGRANSPDSKSFH